MGTGFILTIPEGKRFGFIQDDEGIERHFFHFNNIKCREADICIGRYVNFTIFSIEGRNQAIDIEIDFERGENSEFLENLRNRTPPTRHEFIRRPTHRYDGPVFSLLPTQRKIILEEIANWKLEAKLEDIGRYYFSTPAVRKLLDGERCYVVGRKGSGKTALAERIMLSSKKDLLVDKLTFKGFPFNELYGQDNRSFTRPNQYISIWKLVIYSAACRVLAESGEIEPSVRKKIDRALPANKSDSLGALTGKWIAGDFGMSILGTGFTVTNWFKSKKNYTIHEKVENLEEFFFSNVGNNKVMILFDELDEDYKNMFEASVKGEYLDLITSLFKAVQDIKSVAAKRQAKLYPIIFIRDDIYDIIQDQDKNKWRDFQLNLDWNEEDIRGLLAFRLSKAMSLDDLDLDKMWYSIYSPESIRYASDGKQISSFAYMKMSTMGRPRDYINYMRECSQIELRKCAYASSPEYVIGTDSIKDADKSHSNYLKQELVDEIGGLFPEIEKFMSIFSELRKSVMHINEYRYAYEDRNFNFAVTVPDSDTVLRTLFYFSVIGNVTRSGPTVFKYSRPDAQLNFTEKIIVHRGLMKALQII